ncbi:flexible cuticle protein 12-like isoform X2 [Ostrinia nubilalis]|nr:flexible cuticle protein 12-like [Ostrinia furnacalis]
MNMYIAIWLLCAVAYCIAAPSSLRTLPAVHHEEIHDDFGQYALRYVTAEGIIVSERGRLVPNPDGRDHALVVEGEVSYIGEDGKNYVTKYSAGFDGSIMEGDHIPVAPKA